MPRRRRPRKKGDVPDYGIDIGDEQPVPPQQDKQIVPKPPTYEESLQDVVEGKKEIYFDPQYYPQDPQDYPQDYQEPPHEYDEDEGIDYAVDEKDEERETLDFLGLPNYEDIDLSINQDIMINKRIKMYLRNVIKNASKERQKLNGLKANVTIKCKSGDISEAERQVFNKRLDMNRVILTKYIKTNEKRLEEYNKKGSGIKGRLRRQRGGNVIFFNDPKQLLNKLELIIGETIAGNTSIKMRNMGVTILDILLRMSTINRPQYNKLYNLYFKV